jgi:hypothetical protein
LPGLCLQSPEGGSIALPTRALLNGAVLFHHCSTPTAGCFWKGVGGGVGGGQMSKVWVDMRLFWTWLQPHSFIPERKSHHWPSSSLGTKNKTALLPGGWFLQPFGGWLPDTSSGSPGLSDSSTLGLGDGPKETYFLTIVGSSAHQAAFLLLQRPPVRGKFYGSSPFSQSPLRSSYTQGQFEQGGQGLRS